MADRIVRCSQGHLYTTNWVWWGSFKAIRLGARRIQKCPVCGRMRMTDQVDDADLTAQERLGAESTRDSGIM